MSRKKRNRKGAQPRHRIPKGPAAQARDARIEARRAELETAENAKLEAALEAEKLTKKEERAVEKLESDSSVTPDLIGSPVLEKRASQSLDASNARETCEVAARVPRADAQTRMSVPPQASGEASVVRPQASGEPLPESNEDADVDVRAPREATTATPKVRQHEAQSVRAGEEGQVSGPRPSSRSKNTNPSPSTSFGNSGLRPAGTQAATSKGSNPLLSPHLTAIEAQAMGSTVEETVERFRRKQVDLGELMVDMLRQRLLNGYEEPVRCTETDIIKMGNKAAERFDEEEPVELSREERLLKRYNEARALCELQQHPHIEALPEEEQAALACLIADGRVRAEEVELLLPTG